MNGIRWTLMLGLLVAGGYGVHLHGKQSQTRPEGGTLTAGFGSVPESAPIDEKAAEAGLRERFELYRKLRMQDDVVAMYDLSDPDQRAKIDLRTYLSYYGHGMVRFDDLQLEDIRFDWNKREATMIVKTSAELLVEKLPRSYRLSARTGADDMRSEATAPMLWVRHGDGQWYFRMDAQVAAGQTGDGRGIQSFTGRADDQEGGVHSEEETPR